MLDYDNHVQTSLAMNEANILCPGEEVIYVCTLNEQLSIQWDLSVPNGQQINIIVDIELDPVGMVYNSIFSDIC